MTRELARASGSTKTLGDIVQFLDHRRRPVKASDRRPGPFPYFGANGQQGTIDGFLFDEPLILIAEDGGHFDDPGRGIAYRIHGRTWVNNHAHVLRPMPEVVDSGYLCRVLENYDVSPFISGTTRGKLTKAQAERIEIPLPSLPEQRRIAAILDKADALRRKRKRAVDLLDGLTQSIFLAMFDTTAHHRSLGEVCELIRDGAHKTPTYVETGIPFVTVRNITSGTLNLKETKFISKEEHRELTRRVRPEEGDILVSKDGTIGIPCVVPKTHDFSIFVSIALLKLRRDVVDPFFLAAQIRSAEIQRQIKEASKGIAIRHLHLNDFAKLKIIVPPLADQRRFSARTSKADMGRQTLMKGTSQLETLFASLQHRAFSGQL